ncbi:MAG: SNF2-related protein [Myxococcota bacterium]|jgi:SNF2 family DNA or RNA helicase|nr:SNF2-related protein [Myxococcota bacterium]
MPQAPSAIPDLEWVESLDPVLKPTSDTAQPPPTRIARLIECEHCGWMESEAASHCYRCGVAIQLDVRRDPILQRLGISTRESSIQALDAPSIASSIASSPRCRPQSYLLRIDFERSRLVHGFDDLLSLDQVELDRYDYQLEACKTVLSRMRGRALLADEVGLGKTIEAGLVIKELLARQMIARVLILTPASLSVQWQEELQNKFFEDFHLVQSQNQWQSLRETLAKASGNQRICTIFSLDRAKLEPYASELQAMPWDLVVVDEGHRLKNRATQAYRFVKQLERRYMLLLTATPVHNDLTELYSLIDLLKPGQLGTMRAFKEQFVKSGDARSPENAPALQQLLNDVMIRNRRSQVGIHLPPRRAAVIRLQLPEKERQLYDAVSKFIRQNLMAATKSAQHGQLQLALMTLQRELCSSPAAVADTLAKLAAAAWMPPPQRQSLEELAERANQVGYPAKLDVVLDLLQQFPGKFLIFTEFRKTQNELVHALQESGESVVFFNGQLDAREKEAAVAAFRGPARILVSTESGGEGRNLQFCHQLINFDLPWNPMRLEQRIGRVHRLGQSDEVLVFNLSTRDTLEAYLLEVLVRKIRMFELVVGELDLILGDAGSAGESVSFEELIRDAWLGAEDEIDLQVAIDAIGERFEQSRSRYFDTRKLNEEVFDLLDSYAAPTPKE